MATAAKRKKKNTPSPAQLRARRAFAKMAKARAAARKNKPRKNKTTIKARRVVVLKANSRKRANSRSRRNVGRRDADHPIEVTHHYRSGPPGYLSKHKRYEAQGQQKLFQYNPARTLGGLKRQIDTFQKQARAEHDYSKRLPIIQKLEKALRAYRKLAGLSPYASVTNKARHNSRGRGSAVRRKTHGARRRANAPPSSSRSSVSSLFRSFQGRDARRFSTGVMPAYAPSNFAKLGGLSYLKVKQGGRTQRINFDPKKASLLADGKKRLWIGGARFKPPSVLKNPDEVAEVGEIMEVGYITHKDHLGDGDEVLYFHHMGEETGERPTLEIDSDGFPLIEGGDYTITSDGIEN